MAMDLVYEILEFMQAFVEAEIGDDDFSAFIATLLARLPRDGLDQTFAGKIERSRCKAGETEIRGARCERFCNRLIGLIGRHPRSMPSALK